MARAPTRTLPPFPHGVNPLRFSNPLVKSVLRKHEDINAIVGGFLFDLALIQESKQSSWGYGGASRAVLALERPIDELHAELGSSLRIPRVGPSSMRVVSEVIEGGQSPSAESAVAASSKKDEVELSRLLRDGFLSRARVLQVLADRRLRGPERSEYLGDFQMHSDWSDGSQTLDDIVAACAARGYGHSAVSDHFAIARGMSLEKVAQQRLAIEEVNQRHRGRFRLLQAVEANILADGEIDLPEATRSRVDLVLAAPHSGLRSAQAQTERMLAVTKATGVHVLAHPRGRKYGARPGVLADWDAIFESAAKHGVAVELDGDPDRQDLDHGLAKRALAAGCLFAIDSDAHATDELTYSETGLAHARLAGIPRDRILNCWPLEQLLDWAGNEGPVIAHPC